MKSNYFKDKKGILYLHYANTYKSPFIYKKLGIHIPSNVIFIKSGRQEIIYAPPYDYDYLKKYCHRCIVRTAESLSQTDKNVFEALIKYLLTKKKKVIVPSDFPLWLFNKIKSAKIDIVVEDFYFFRTVIIKNSKEIKIIEKNAAIVKQCFKYIVGILTRSRVRKNCLYYYNQRLDTERLIAYINEFLGKRGLVCEIPVIAVGRNTYYPHMMKNQIIRANEPVIIDLACRDIAQGYYIDVSRTYCKGLLKPDILARLHKEILNIKFRLEKEIIQNKLIAVMYNLAADLFAQAGILLVSRNCNNVKMPIFHHSLGHGVGRELHELPLIDKDINVPFEKNMIIAFEPACYLKNIGGIRIEDTYLITKSKTYNLTSGNYDCEIK